MAEESLHPGPGKEFTREAGRGASDALVEEVLAEVERMFRG